MRFNNALSTSAGCWPFTTFIYSMVRTANVDDQCINAPRALKFLQFLHDQTSVTAEAAAFLSTFTSTGADASLSKLLTSDSSESTTSSTLARTSQIAEQMGALWATPGVRALVQAKLKLVTCDGETILITLPVDHKISTEIQSGTMGISILGVCLIALILCFIYFFHLRSAIKASSPLFLIGTVGGLLMLFLSGTLLAQTDPTDDTCAGGWWMLNMGFFFTFGPLFAKTWRIYKIFMRKEMTVIRLTDMNLIARLAIALAIELVLMGAMQSSDAVKAQMSIQANYPRDQTLYYCAPDQVGFAAAIASIKGVVLLFGALMSFSTRSVSENFNESKPIAMTVSSVACDALIPPNIL
jgi:heme/copper-type cytochrome/quinol oxidase subunit 4